MRWRIMHTVSTISHFPGCKKTKTQRTENNYHDFLDEKVHKLTKTQSD